MSGTGETSGTRVTIEKLGHKGDGVAAVAQGNLFVPFTLPGEVVEVSDVDNDRAGKVRIIEPSVHRIAAPCKHFKRCGGCALQHGDDATIAAFKRQQIVTALAQQGIDAPVADTITVPTHSRRRLTLKAQRSGKNVLIGYTEARGDQLVPVKQCPVADPVLIEFLPVLEGYLGQILSRRTKAVVHLLATETGIDLGIEMTREPSLDDRMDAAAFADEADLARLWWNGEMMAERTAPIVRFGGIDVRVPPRSFLQATKPSDQILGDGVAMMIGKAGHVADLFAGLGTFTFALAAHAHVTAVDGARAAMTSVQTAADRAAGEGKINSVTTIVRDLFRRPMLPSDLKDFDAVVFDPPRAGAIAQAEQLAQSAVPIIVAVSCNPASFARDARILIDGGYQLEGVTPLDQFRWSAHVELMAKFVCRKTSISQNHILS